MFWRSLTANCEVLSYETFDLVTSPARAFAPGGESWQEFLERVRATLDRLAVRFAGQTVVAATHAGFIVASVLVLFDIPRPGTGARPRAGDIKEHQHRGHDKSGVGRRDHCLPGKAYS